MKRLLPVLTAAVLGIGAGDPRPHWIDQQLSGEFEMALTEVDERRSQPAGQQLPPGVDYLRGHLLEHLDRAPEAPAAFSEAMTSDPELADHARFRLALDRYRTGHPAAAAGLLATLLTNDPPADLVSAAVRWLTLALLNGGDCRLLVEWQQWPLSSTQSRQLQAALVECATDLMTPEEENTWLRSLLARKRSDETARRAALALAQQPITSLDPQTQLLVGLTFFHHREFERAIPYLVGSLESSAEATRSLRRVDRADVLYSLARSHYWLRQYDSASQTFTQAALEESDDGKSAKALFQRGRSRALSGDWDGAVESYREAVAAAPIDTWAAAALLSAMRLEWRQGREEEALELFRRLQSRRSWRISIERAGLFLAASDLVRGRADRAAGWLDVARRARRRAGPEIWYWRGRLAELQELPDVAVDRYLDILQHDALHPLSREARRRLAQPGLRSAAMARAESLAQSNRSADWRRSWLLREADDAATPELEEKLRARWRSSSRYRPYLDMRPTAATEWRIWRQRSPQPDDLLLTLGIVENVSSASRRVFPLSDNGLALARSQLLAANLHHRSSLHSAEVLSDRVPADLPFQFLPDTFRTLLYPRPYAFLVEQQASRFGVDPDLLSAIIREESRYDAMAVSAASARGLTQFVVPTARRLADKLGWQEHDPVDLFEPEVAITLGAAYLAELAAQFADRPEQVVAAYNAGEDLARLWQAFCFSREPAEYYSKVGFRQTRGYLEKVLKSRAHYAQLQSQPGRP